VFLSAIEIEKIREEAVQNRPLLVTKDSPRKAYFKRLNRDRRTIKSVKKYRDTGIASRGNIWAGNAQGQKVVVKINPVKNKARKISTALNSRGGSVGGSGANLSAHIRYISRSGAGQNEEKAVLFNKEKESVDPKDFFEKSRNDRHHFRMIISPENSNQIDDFQGYVRDVMMRVERDLDTKLTWVSAIHYDTDDIHAHVIIRGKNDRGHDLVIARDYISSGIRMRAQERATELLGMRSLEEISKSIEKEVDALRVTSLDRFIENNLDEVRKLDVRKENNFGKSRTYEQALKGRLHYLESTGLATQYPPGVFKLEENFKDILYGIQNRKDVLRQLHGRINEADLDGLSLYSIQAGEGETIEGFVKTSGFVDEITDRKYLVLEDMGDRLHYVPVGGNARIEDLQQGSLIRIRPGDRSSGKADYNINLIARQNSGVYDVDIHRAYIESDMGFMDLENRQIYLDSHIKRLETLEQNAVVERLEEGRFRVPDDVISKGEIITRDINERENKRFYPYIDILADDPLQELVSAEKKTWLDKELFKNSKGKSGLVTRGVKIQEALEGRKSWLLEKDMAFMQSNGEFALREGALRKLDNMEISRAGEMIASEYNIQLETNKVKENTQYRYLGFVKLETGFWAVVGSQQNTLMMAQLEQKPALKKNAYIEFDRLDKQYFVMRETERSKQKSQDEEMER